MTRAVRRALAFSLLVVTLLLAPAADRALGLQWGTAGLWVTAQAAIWVMAGRLAVALGRPSLRGASWGFLAISALGAGLNRWLIASVGGQILLGSPLAQMGHAAGCLAVGMTVGWVLRPRARVETAAVRTLGQRMLAPLRSRVSPRPPVASSGAQAPVSGGPIRWEAQKAAIQKRA